MPRSKSRRTVAVERVRSLPWAAALQVSMVLGRRWRNLSEKDRARLVRIVRDSRGRLSNLTAKEREDLRRLARKADLRAVGRDLLALRGGRRLRKRR